MTRPLLPARRSALAVAAAAWLVLLGMALWLHDTSAPTGFDSSVRSWLFAHLGVRGQEVTLGFSEPALTIGGCALVTVCALLLRRWNVAVLAAVGPLLGLVLESHVLKPAIDRRFGLVATLSHGAVPPGYAFPSGHETGVTTLTALLVILLLRSRASRAVAVVLVLLAAVWTVVAAVGLVRNDYHYATDTVGGVALGVGVMVTLALLLDAVTARVSSPAGSRSEPGPARHAAQGRAGG